MDIILDIMSCSAIILDKEQVLFPSVDVGCGDPEDGDDVILNIEDEFHERTIEFSRDQLDNVTVINGTEIQLYGNVFFDNGDTKVERFTIELLRKVSVC